jgi:outer membrane protein, multidrug efflux system
MRRPPCLLWLALLALGAGCTVGPDYKRPTVDVPASYRGEAMEAARAASLGEAQWWEVFRDQELQWLILRALQANYDVRIAAVRVLQSRARLTITRADQFPTISAGATAGRQRQGEQLFGGLTVPPFEFDVFQLSAMLSWELDFWGKFRRATESARADLLGSEWARRAVTISVISAVAGAYFQLRELDLELEIARRTLATREESLSLVQIQEQGGIVSLLDVRQAEQLVFTAAETITDVERRLEQQENALSILLGQNPGPIPRGLTLTDQPQPPEVPAGLPSALLERRPDIRQAEQALIAANAQIGVAKAAYFPSISLTGAGGVQSFALASLFAGPAGFWSLAGTLVQPIFTAGRIKGTVRLTEAQAEELVNTYRRTIQQGFQDVSNALVGYRKAREFRERQAQLAASTEDAARLSDLRYRGGATSYLEVLTSQTNFFSAELGLAQARLNELLALVQLYSALGGGWSP